MVFFFQYEKKKTKEKINKNKFFFSMVEGKQFNSIFMNKFNID